MIKDRPGYIIAYRTNDRILIIARGIDSYDMARRKELAPMVNWLYDLMLWTFSILVDLFFREVHPRGSWKVPRRGPIIFVAAPHANQVSRYVVVLSSMGADFFPVCRSSYSDASDSNGSTSTNCFSHR